jgi:hypothetical protein
MAPVLQGTYDVQLVSVVQQTQNADSIGMRGITLSIRIMIRKEKDKEIK